MNTFYQWIKKIIVLRKLLYGSFFLIFLFALLNCKHSPNEILVPKTDTSKVIVITPTPQPPNIKDSVCFEQDILPILRSNCALSDCHNNVTKESDVDLSSYQTLIETITGTQLIKKIQSDGDNRMPPNPMGKLTESQINLIKKWKDEGMLNGRDCSAECDTGNITFNATVFPIIQDACLGCHNTTMPTIKDYYETLAIVENGTLWCTINENNCSLMPQGGPKLSPCKISKIKKWIDMGAPNN